MVRHVPKCLFCDVARGNARSHLVIEDDLAMAILDPFPIRAGHTLIISKTHYSCFDELPDDALIQTGRLAQRIARVMKQRYGVARVAFFFAGTQIDHAHAHLVPMHDDTDLTSRRYIAEESLTFRGVPRENDASLVETARYMCQALQYHVTR